MLNAKEVRQVGIYRFWRNGIWQYRNWYLGLSIAWIIIMLVVMGICMCNIVPQSRLAYTIPSSAAEGGKDIDIVFEKGSGYTVNGYLLKPNVSGTDNGSMLGLFFLMAIVPCLAAFIVDIIGDSKSSRYADDVVQKWVDTKEI
jgi:hypothetical protein